MNPNTKRFLDNMESIVNQVFNIIAPVLFTIAIIVGIVFMLVNMKPIKAATIAENVRQLNGEFDVGLQLRSGYNNYRMHSEGYHYKSVRYLSEAYISYEQPIEDYKHAIWKFYHSSEAVKHDDHRGYNQLSIGYRYKTKLKVNWKGSVSHGQPAATYYVLLGVVDETYMTPRDNPVVSVAFRIYPAPWFYTRGMYIRALDPDKEYNTYSYGIGVTHKF